MTWDQQYGWAEASHPTAIDMSTARQIIPAKAGYQTIIRRVRGSSNGDFSLRSGASTKMGNPFGSGNLDVPGLSLRANIGEAVFISGTAATSTNLFLQYAYTRVMPSDSII